MLLLSNVALLLPLASQLLLSDSAAANPPQPHHVLTEYPCELEALVAHELFPPQDSMRTVPSWVPASRGSVPLTAAPSHAAVPQLHIPLGPSAHENAPGHVLPSLFSPTVLLSPRPLGSPGGLGPGGGVGPFSLGTLGSPRGGAGPVEPRSFVGVHKNQQTGNFYAFVMDGTGMHRLPGAREQAAQWLRCVGVGG